MPISALRRIARAEAREGMIAYHRIGRTGTLLERRERRPTFQGIRTRLGMERINRGRLLETARKAFPLRERRTPGEFLRNASAPSRRETLLRTLGAAFRTTAPQFAFAGAFTGERRPLNRYEEDLLVARRNHLLRMFGTRFNTLK